MTAAARCVVFNCEEDEVTRERLGFRRALARVLPTVVGAVRRVTPDAVCLANGHRIPSAEVHSLWHPDPLRTPIPAGLPAANVKSLIMHMDAGSATPWRTMWSRLFDVACLCCWDGSGYFSTNTFRIVTQSYAAQREWLEESPAPMRDLELGWAGTTQGELYGERARLVPQLAARYRMNDWLTWIPEAEIPALYRRSRVVVNIQRDDYPLHYNVRCFEALAAGALLLVREGSTLSADTGLVAGIHFATFRDDADLFAKLDYFLAHDAERVEVAEAGREAVRRGHTYDHRVAELLRLLDEMPSGRPGRRPMRTGEIDYIYGHFYAKRLRCAEAGAHLSELVRGGSLRALPLFAHYARARWHLRKAAHASTAA